MRRLIVVAGKTVLILLLTVLAVYLLLAISALITGFAQVRGNAKEQEKRMTWLREEFYPGYEARADPGRSRGRQARGF